MKKHIEYLQSLDACHGAVDFANKHKSLKTAWEACPRSDWMLWLLGHINYRDDRNYRLYASWAASWAAVGAAAGTAVRDAQANQLRVLFPWSKVLAAVTAQRIERGAK